ncbi:hypothetical protein F4780DRAFT_788739 [Xylariomycetidae sp. FL0641]|nr:hypothetical protein F4780DRAFT_788739 [Xylariomycetidae sp. FL0641]
MAGRAIDYLQPKVTRAGGHRTKNNIAGHRDDPEPELDDLAHEYEETPRPRRPTEVWTGDVLAEPELDDVGNVSLPNAQQKESKPVEVPVLLLPEGSPPPVMPESVEEEKGKASEKPKSPISAVPDVPDSPGSAGKEKGKAPEKPKSPISAVPDVPDSPVSAERENGKAPEKRKSAIAAVPDVPDSKTPPKEPKHPKRNIETIHIPGLPNIKIVLPFTIPGFGKSNVEKYSPQSASLDPQPDPTAPETLGEPRFSPRPGIPPPSPPPIPPTDKSKSYNKFKEAREELKKKKKLDKREREAVKKKKQMDKKEEHAAKRAKWAKEKEEHHKAKYQELKAKLKKHREKERKKGKRVESPPPDLPAGAEGSAMVHTNARQHGLDGNRDSPKGLSGCGRPVLSPNTRTRIGSGPLGPPSPTRSFGEPRSLVAPSNSPPWAQRLGFDDPVTYRSSSPAATPPEGSSRSE